VMERLGWTTALGMVLLESSDSKSTSLQLPVPFSLLQRRTPISELPLVLSGRRAAQLTYLQPALALARWKLCSPARLACDSPQPHHRPSLVKLRSPSSRRFAVDELPFLVIAKQVTVRTFRGLGKLFSAIWYCCALGGSASPRDSTPGKVSRLRRAQSLGATYRARVGAWGGVARCGVIFKMVERVRDRPTNRARLSRGK
jgi:hypothetical protein